MMLLCFFLQDVSRDMIAGGLFLVCRVYRIGSLNPPDLNKMKSSGVAMGAGTSNATVRGSSRSHHSSQSMTTSVHRLGTKTRCSVGIMVLGSSRYHNWSSMPWTQTKRYSPTPSDTLPVAPSHFLRPRQKG